MQLIVNIMTPAGGGTLIHLQHIGDPGAPLAIFGERPSIACAKLAREIERRLTLDTKTRLYRKETS